MNKKTHHRRLLSRPLAGSLAILLTLTLTVQVWAVVFTNPAPITINDATAIGVGSPYPATIAVSGLMGMTTNVAVTLSNINHSFPDDFDMLLVAPGGQNLILMSDVGGSEDVTNTTITIDDAAIASLPDSTKLTNGSFKPTNIGGGDTFPAPAPAPSANTTLAAAFNGADPNGNWSLYVVDDLGADMGVLGNGWSLTVTTSMSSATTFSNGAAIHSGDGARGRAATYPSTIAVSGLTGSITDVNVTLTNINHLNPDDIDILLVSPTGRRILLMSDAGGTTDAVGVNLTFDDAGTAVIPDAGPLVSGTVRPTNFGSGDSIPDVPGPYPNAAPAGTATLASVFNGTDPNGTWSLYVVDDATTSAGNIMSGWSIDIIAGGTFGAQPYAPSDFDGDGKTDVAVQRPSDLSWYWRESSTYANRAYSQFGVTGDKIVPADYDGDRMIDIAIFRQSSGTWYIVQSATNTLRQEVWGQNGDVPLPEDYDGDRVTDLAVYRSSPDPTQNYFYWRRSSDGMPANVEWGQQGDLPLRGHFEGTAGADFVVYRPSDRNWYILNNAGSSYRVITFGTLGDQLVPGDYDGDAKTDVAVFRPSSGDWYILRSSTGTVLGVHWGETGDMAVPTDYDADGQTDIAVWRPTTGAWYIVNSGASLGSDALRIENWGRFGDKPLPSAYVPEH